MAGPRPAHYSNGPALRHRASPATATVLGSGAGMCRVWTICKREDVRSSRRHPRRLRNRDTGDPHDTLAGFNDKYLVALEARNPVVDQYIL